MSRPPRRATAGRAAAVAAAVAVLLSTAPVAPTAQAAPAASDATWQRLETPVDPRQQTALGFGDRSHWLQPWRAYLDTPPVDRLRSALGIVFNVPPELAGAAARLLADSGIRRARIEEGWGSVSYANADSLSDRDAFAAELRALKAAGIRPLILLNANHASPVPRLRLTLTLAAPAAAGARMLRLDPGSAARVVPGLTGLDDRGRGKAAATLLTAVAPDGTASLSRPLPAALPAGPAPASTLRFEPFGRPRAADGSPNPRFEATLRGWLDYVAVVTGTARAALGGSGFDVEIWNELSFGSDFLDASTYYAPLPSGLGGRGEAADEILRRTVAWLRDPARGLGGIGITDGFASQTPFPSGATAPSGLTALSKHPYAGPRHTFGSFEVRPNRPLDALARPDGFPVAPNRWVDAWSPRYTAYFPELYLTGIESEHLVRDLSPITTWIGGTPHGRLVAPAGGNAPQVWVTETGFSAAPAGLTGADRWHLMTKATLRTLVAFLNKGAGALYLYAALGTDFGLVDPNAWVASWGTSGGPVTDALRRLAGFAGTGTPATPRPLALRSVADEAGDVQFGGDGTAAHPSLANREVTAVLPFQATDHRWVVAAYVMTRDLARVYDAAAPASDPRRHDLPARPYRLELAGVHGDSATVTAFDPAANTSVPVTVAARDANAITVELPLTDSVRLLRIEDR